MISFKYTKTSCIPTKPSLQKILLMFWGVLSQQLEALNLPRPEQTKHRPFFVNLFWTTGLEGAMPEIHSFSPTPEALKDMPPVELGGSSIGSKKTFDGIREFLQAVQKKNPHIKLIFTVDNLTYWANKQGFESLKEQFPDHFRVSRLEELAQNLEKETPVSSKLLKDFSTTFGPALGSDCFRMMALFQPQWLGFEKYHSYSAAYFDIDNFFDGIEQSHKKRKNSLEIILNQKPLKKYPLFGIKMPYPETNAFRVDASDPSFLNNFRRRIEKRASSLGIKQYYPDYYNRLLQILLRNTPVSNYLKDSEKKVRQVLANPQHIYVLFNFLLDIRSLIKFVPSPPPKRAFEWGLGVRMNRITSKIQKDPLAKTFKRQNPSFIENFLETCSIGTDLLKLAPLGKWFAWQEKYFPGNTIELKKKSLKDLTDCAFKRLADIYPFSKINSSKKGVYGKICTHIVEKLKKAYPQDLRVSTYEHAQNFSSKTSHIKKLSSPDD
ncbi:MAG: hypothetical protein BGO07_02220 [Alphaproteobacteria bacterium 40-19]|nr:MAG: hypothetical protein BGO07_02220 [Alphaproteobacteria bacterium 40-19]